MKRRTAILAGAVSIILSMASGLAIIETNSQASFWKNAPEAVKYNTLSLFLILGSVLCMALLIANGSWENEDVVVAKTPVEEPVQ